MSGFWLFLVTYSLLRRRVRMKLCGKKFSIFLIPFFTLVSALPLVCPGAQPEPGRLPACPEVIDLTGKGNSDGFLASGFSAQEEWGRWTEGKTAVVACSLSDAAVERPRKMKLYALGYVGKASKQRVEISFNGKNAGTYSFTPSPVETELDVPEVKGPDLRITFNIKKPSSPLSNGESTDPRNLGLGVISMKFLK
jgi:hypothetical protein